MWVSDTGRIGITEVLTRLLTVLLRIDWLVDEYDQVDIGQQFVQVTALRREESLGPAAQLTLVSPVAGLVVERNPKLIEHAILKFREDPFALLQAPYEEGWLADIEIAGEPSAPLLPAASYRDYVSGLLTRPD